MKEVIDEILENLEEDNFGDLSCGEIKNSLAVEFLNKLAQAHNDDMLCNTKDKQQSSNVLGNTIRLLVNELLNVKQ